MAQILSTQIVDTVSVTLTSATLTLTQGAYTYGPVTATISPASASTNHTLSVTLPSPLPTGMTVGSASAMWAWLRNGSARSATTSVTVNSASVGPLNATTTPSPVQIRAGDTSPAFPVVLTDGNGNAVDGSLGTWQLNLRAVWAPDPIPGGTATWEGASGQFLCTLPVLNQRGYYYSYLTDGNGNSYPDTGPGFLIIVAPAATS